MISITVFNLGLKGLAMYSSCQRAPFKAIEEFTLRKSKMVSSAWNGVWRHRLQINYVTLPNGPCLFYWFFFLRDISKSFYQPYLKKVRFWGRPFIQSSRKSQRLMAPLCVSAHMVSYKQTHLHSIQGKREVWMSVRRGKRSMLTTCQGLVFSRTAKMLHGTWISWMCENKRCFVCRPGTSVVFGKNVLRRELIHISSNNLSQSFPTEIRPFHFIYKCISFDIHIMQCTMAVYRTR